MIASSEKPTVTSWISWRNGVCIAAPCIRIWVAQSVVRYFDVMITKSGSVAGAVIHCEMLILILSQLDRIISIIVVKGEQESFTGRSITATRTWVGNKSFTHSKHFGWKKKQIYTETILYKEFFRREHPQRQKKQYSARGSDLLAKAFNLRYAW